jgi:hypothetical protein
MMGRSSRAWFGCVTALVFGIVCPLATASPQDAGSETTQLLFRARQKYYNLRREGLVRFESRIEPNWKVLLGDDQTPDTLKLLDAIHFFLSVDSESKLRVSHRSDVMPVNDKSAAAFDQIYRQMNQAVSRFFVTWSIFMLTSPFPEQGSEFELEQKPDQFRFLQVQPDRRTLTITDRNFMITEMIVRGEDFTASLKPELENTGNGYILKGYISTYETPSGARNTLLKVSMDYEQIGSLRLPHKVNLETVYEGKPAQLEWLFTDYKVAKH